MMHDNVFPAAKTYRRLLAIFYDCFLVLPLLMVASALPLLVSGGEARQGGDPILTLYLMAVCFFFFGWFWTHGGQTLGMRAWRLQLQRSSGESLDWTAAFIRFITGLPAWLTFIVGIAVYLLPETPLPGVLRNLQALPDWSVFLLGIAWLVFDNRPDSLRDLISKTRVIQLPPAQKSARESTQAPE